MHLFPGCSTDLQLFILNFSEEEESRGIFIWGKKMRIKMIFPMARFGSNLTLILKLIFFSKDLIVGKTIKIFWW